MEEFLRMRAGDPGLPMSQRVTLSGAVYEGCPFPSLHDVCGGGALASLLRGHPATLLGGQKVQGDDSVRAGVLIIAVTVMGHAAFMQDAACRRSNMPACVLWRIVFCKKGIRIVFKF